MNPQGADLLAQLRDIHQAPAVGWWPPAPGWWVLALFALLALTWLGRQAWRAWRRGKERKALLQWVDRIEREVDPEHSPGEYLGRVNALLKWVALRAFPEQGCAAMQGAEWARFVGAKLSGEPDSATLDVLASGPYEARPQFDRGAVRALARAWIERHG